MIILISGNFMTYALESGCENTKDFSLLQFCQHFAMPLLSQELPPLIIGDIKEPEDCFKMIFCSAATGK